ncbi:hypothetical protein NQZ68_027130 [Dissostichus eleginoides]|nr:hypothetical protein NQZ68_027130 [Dissostichus eleginoides]
MKPSKTPQLLIEKNHAYEEKARTWERQLPYGCRLLPTVILYLTWLEVYLTNLENTHPGAKDLLSKGSIAVARSMIPGALSAVDKTIHFDVHPPVWGIPEVVSNNLHTGTVLSKDP